MSVVVVREPGGVVVVRESSEAPVVIERTRMQVVEIAGSGPQGIQGEPGAPGGGFFYLHDQAIASATWTIVHGLGGFPNVTVVDSTGREVIGDTQYVDADTIVVSFVAPFAGAAYLS